MDASTAERIRTLITPLLHQEGVELFDLNVHRHGREWQLKIFVDRPSGGITIAQCAQLNHSIGRLLEEEKVCTGGFALELSSPGADRPLKTASDFRRVLGKFVKLDFLRPLGNRREFIGELKAVGDDQIALSVEGEEHAIRISDIDKAVEYI